ncbi:Hypothetical_protein [Hexamita inflata]|uniref:Hypothetical_protein n=1 Tax=Hexamita inflata TaxID=28002 RepID=A0AA86Q6Y2_9EUKA|nr:Hypothetical protein HINF_LOCUS40956 [Hexamita inflata]
MSFVSQSIYSKVLAENRKLKEDNRILRGQLTHQQKDRKDNLNKDKPNEDKAEKIDPPFLGEMFNIIQSRYTHFQKTGTKLVYSDNELMFWMLIRTKAPSIYKYMIQQFGAPSDSNVRKAKYTLLHNQPEENLNQFKAKQYYPGLVKILGFTQKTYKSRFLVGEMLILKRIYIENQDATIPQICELFQKETQMAISAYTAKRILEGLNVGKNHVINKYLLDKGVDVDFKW